MTKREKDRDFPPLSPGSVLQERIVSRLGVSQGALAKALGVSRFTVNHVLGGRRRFPVRIGSIVLGMFLTSGRLGGTLEAASERKAQELQGGGSRAVGAIVGRPSLGVRRLSGI